MPIELLRLLDGSLVTRIISIGLIEICYVSHTTGNLLIKNITTPPSFDIRQLDILGRNIRFNAFQGPDIVISEIHRYKSVLVGGSNNVDFYVYRFFDLREEQWT